MKIELDKTYNPREVETKWYEIWERSGYFQPKIDPRKKPYVVVIPPPNVTGILHMGHALNNTIQDILVRWHRMMGEPTLWVPGTDHAGIATQNVVEKRLAKEGKTRHDFSREEFLKQVWKWKEEHGSTIVRQLRRLGSSCDWSRERFTMDEGLSRAVREAFVTLYEKGLIYQGHYIINWCPRCHTALSDEEAPHKEMEGMLYYIQYPVKGRAGEHVTIATTRPETMLGDTAVAVNPKDERYHHLAKEKLILPLVGRELAVIQDEFVDPDFGSGLVKVTPAHDPNDFEMGKRHNLEFINVMHPDGRMNEKGGKYAGMDRFNARKQIVEDLEAEGLLVKKVSHLHAVGHCYRCHTVIEPYFSKQWFVKMRPLADKAASIVREGKVNFVPDRWTKVYLNWMDGIRDWCISRQIWWGHRIPVWYCEGNAPLPPGGRGIKGEGGNCPPIVSRETPAACPSCGSTNLRQDEDVLDTWFSSWLWPFSTLGWPQKTKDLSYFYPTTDLVTASEIIFFWVARMIMAGSEFMKEPPFSTVNIHGTIRTETGAKMSKSLGNIIDPLDVIEHVGADALRFSLMMITGAGQDAFLSSEKFEIGRNFANKIWNACRFAFLNLKKESFESFDLSDAEIAKLGWVDQWIVAALNQSIEEVNRALESYRFNDACSVLYHFFWHDFCDWYIELTKSSVVSRQSSEKVLLHVLEKSLRLLHPLMPFQTEELWQKIKPISKKPLGETIMTAPWPKADPVKGQEAPLRKARLLKEIVSLLRNFRAEHEIDPKKGIHVVIESEMGTVRELGEEIKLLVQADAVLFQSSPKGYLKAGLVSGAIVYINAKQDIDITKRKKTIAGNITKLESYIRTLESKLANADFKTRAPEAVYQAETDKLQDSKKKLTHFQQEQKALAELG
ncbi:MAG: valine--tRNA ligase [Candidatus Omnitrophica bacterium]|nr:valine--tRNA ligase [Candidatus Omnitrophota bacterium]